MSTYNNIRLEKSGVVVAYFAPNFQVSPNGTNDLVFQRRAGGDPPICRDILQVAIDEVLIQGTFIDTTDLPSDHAAALRTVFGVGAGEVTAQMQVRRLWNYFLKVGGPFEFHNDGDEYTKTNKADVDYTTGKFPAVNIRQISPVETAGRASREWTIRLTPGVTR